jgi:hypothetical protein
MNLLKRLRKLGTDRRGTTVLEFALVSPLLIVMILGIVECGLYWFMAQSVETAAGEEARAAVARVNRGRVCMGAPEAECVVSEQFTRAGSEPAACFPLPPPPPPKEPPDHRLKLLDPQDWGRCSAGLTALRNRMAATFPILRAAVLQDPVITTPDAYSVQVTVTYPWTSIVRLASRNITVTTRLNHDAP